MYEGVRIGLWLVVVFVNDSRIAIVSLDTMITDQSSLKLMVLYSRP